MSQDRFVGYCEALVKGICTKPEEVRIEAVRDDLGVLLKISVARDDMRMIIGLQGETAKAIRRLVRVAGQIEHARVAIKILEPIS